MNSVEDQDEETQEFEENIQKVVGTIEDLLKTHKRLDYDGQEYNSRGSVKSVNIE